MSAAADERRCYACGSSRGVRRLPCGVDACASCAALVDGQRGT
ncbi:hypothetical protein [Halobaculum magnesiiphilum]|nr:hypothetical protein [Halobaculum magnesiiphilum]